MDILTLLRANLRAKKGAFKSIVALILLITMSASGMFSANANMRDNMEKSMQRIDAGDLVVWQGDKYVTDALLQQLEDSALTSRVKDHEILVANAMELHGELRTNMVGIRKYPEDSGYDLFNEKRTALQTHSPEPAAGEVYIPLGLATSYKCKPGDSLALDSRNGKHTYRIAGIVEEPFFGSSAIGYKQIFCSDADYAELQTLVDEQDQPNAKLFAFHLLEIYRPADCTLSPNAWKRQLQEENGVLDMATSTLSKEDSMHYSLLFQETGTRILFAFIILLFLAVLMLMGYSISTTIQMEYTNIGVLKAQGFTNGRIRAVLVLQYLLAECIGSVLGLLLAMPLTIVITTCFKLITGIAFSASLSLLPSVATVMLLLLVGAGFVLLCTRKVGRVSPLRAISGGQDSVYFASRLPVPVRKRGMDVWIALRQLTSSKRQYLSMLLIVSILVYFMMSITMLANCMDSKQFAESYNSVYSDVYLTFNEKLEDTIFTEVEADIEEVVPIKQLLYSRFQYIMLDGNEYACTIYSDPSRILVDQGRAPLYDNEIIVTDIMAEELGKRMGDTVKMRFRGEEAEYVISGYYQSLSDVGLCFSCSKAALDRIHAKLYYTIGYLDLEDPAQAPAVISMLEARYAGQVSGTQEMDSGEDLISAALNALGYIINGISVLFALIVVTMVCNKTMIQERRSIGIYRALGFSVRRLRLQFALRFLLVALLGSLLGIALCVLYNDKMMSQLLKMIGITRFRTEYGPSMLLLPVLLISLSFFLFSYLASRRVRMVEVRSLVTE